VTAEAQQMIEHITRIMRRRGVQIDENTPLLSSGLIDSMGLLDALVKLEEVTHMRNPTQRYGHCRPHVRHRAARGKARQVRTDRSLRPIA
jgi:hypothetical protein